ncbi:LysR family transcriptional regulator [Thalassospira profundimaris]|uniref:Transcriptional regulator n=1 Tax=Thalassospira profundimaris TaxID=502049 RepID=A0A367X7Y3_9PROT|nr:LysR family transcriptional regulator [Thalassospira profundimaris]RCK49220.1 transcriptional regulator [Thalassospira profundimaris]
MDKLVSLQSFVRVVEQGSFAAAARAIGQSRSQVNRAVVALEDDLGVQLLNRTTRTVSVTPSGRAFYQRAKAILTDLDEAEESIRENQEKPAGDIRINAPMSFGTLHLGPALVDFARMYPEIRVELALNDHFIDPVADGFDMTVRISRPTETLALIDHEIIPIRRVICASPDFLHKNGEPTDISDLATLPCLHYGNLPGGSTWKLTGPNGPVSVQVNGVFCCNNAEVLRDAAIAGLGLVELPTFIAGAELQTGRLVTVLCNYTPPEIFLYLLYPPSRQLSSRIRLLVDFMHDRFGGQPHWDLVQ